jgi:hypothetical protein
MAKKARKQTVTATEAMIAMVELNASIPWVNNAGITDDIEALRKICLAYMHWHNTVYVPLMKQWRGDTQLDP